MDDDWGYPYFRKPPYGYVSLFESWLPSHKPANQRCLFSKSFQPSFLQPLRAISICRLLLGLSPRHPKSQTCRTHAAEKCRRLVSRNNDTGSPLPMRGTSPRAIYKHFPSSFRSHEDTKCCPIVGLFCWSIKTSIKPINIH